MRVEVHEINQIVSIAFQCSEGDGLSEIKGSKNVTIREIREIQWGSLQEVRIRGSIIKDLHHP